MIILINLKYEKTKDKTILLDNIDKIYMTKTEINRIKRNLKQIQQKLLSIVKIKYQIKIVIYKLDENFRCEIENTKNNINLYN